MDTRDATTLPVPSPSLEALEHRITELSAHIHAATYRLLCLIADFDRRKGWARQGIRSCAHWLNWKCGIGLVAACDKVRVARSLESLPQIGGAFRDGRLSYSKVRAMTRIATAENEDYLLDIARHGTAAHVERLVSNYRKVQRIAEDTDIPWWMRDVHETQSYTQRRADALVLMAESLLANGAASRTGGARNQMIVHLDAEVLADAEAAGRSELENGPSLAGETARRLACDASIVRLVEDGDGLPLDVGRRTRSIPPAIHRALKARDRGCRFPGCTARHFVEGHHVKHWAHGGETSLANLVQLCHFHHRLVHEGGYSVRVIGPQRFEFACPDGRIIAPVRENDSAESFRDTDIETLNREHALDIDAGTCVSRWDGTMMDYAMAVDGLLGRDGALRLDPATGRYSAHFPGTPIQGGD